VHLFNAILNFAMVLLLLVVVILKSGGQGLSFFIYGLLFLVFGGIQLEKYLQFTKITKRSQNGENSDMQS